MKKTSLFFILIIGVGCATPMKLLVNTQTGETVNCSASGFGVIQAIGAQMSVDNCVKAYKTLGFKDSADLTEEERQAIKTTKPTHGRELNIPIPASPPLDQNRINQQILNHGAGGCTPNFSTGGCL